MPFGADFFDYKLAHGSLHKGDLVLVPFRNKLIPALVARLSRTSEYQDRTISLTPKKIFKFPETLADFCIQASRESFVSPPTMLNAWIRHVPKRLDNYDVHVLSQDAHRPADKPMTETRLLVNRYTEPRGIIEAARAEQSNGRVLIITPWKKRVEYLSQRIGCAGYHALTSDGEVWRKWTSFLEQSHGVLTVTRVGAWLACLADVVILDEPENDDHKQDELTPRYDARRLIELAQEINPALRVIKIGTTPQLITVADELKDVPRIDIQPVIAPFAPGHWSDVEAMTATALNGISDAVEEKRAVRILHPVYGTRGRIRCADCGWVMECPSCGTGMNNDKIRAICRHCGTKSDLPADCPKCGGVNLSKAMIGCEELQKRINLIFPLADIKVLDLHEWLHQSLMPRSLVLLSNLSLIGGYSEDIRKRERLIIAFRRLAAQTALAQCDLIIQGHETLVYECRDWLEPDGLKRAWAKELEERSVFKYPPAVKMVKLLAPGKLENMKPIELQLKTLCEKFTEWNIRGPFAIENQPKSRQPRCVFHLIPPKNMEML